jgi:putative transposase
MKRSCFSDEQIIRILKEHEAGVSVADLCRKHGVSEASIYGQPAEDAKGRDSVVCRRSITMSGEKG